MIIDHDSRVTCIQVKPQEKIEIAFNPKGANAVNGQPTIRFSMTTFTFFTGQMGLVLHLPAKNLYECNGTLIIMDEPNGADTITIDGHLYTKVKDIGTD